MKSACHSEPERQEGEESRGARCKPRDPSVARLRFLRMTRQSNLLKIANYNWKFFSISMLIIFDLDYTLLDTLEFKKGLAEALNLEFDVYHKNCKKYFKDKDILYNLEKHLKILEQENSDFKINENFLSNIGKYLFPEADDILKKMKDAGHKLVLLTYGDVQWQKMKVENLKIKKYFDEIIYTDKGKGEVIRNSKTPLAPLLERGGPGSTHPLPLSRGEEKILIVNDNARECLEMREAIGDCEIFLVKGRYSENVEHDLEIRELGEINNFKF